MSINFCVFTEHAQNMCDVCVFTYNTEHAQYMWLIFNTDLVCLLSMLNMCVTFSTNLVRLL